MTNKETYVSLETGIRSAVEAHAGAVDIAGRPYILHPLRVMMSVKTDLEKTAAVLHDVVEDTDWTLERLESAGIPRRALNAVDAVTRRDDEDYEAFIERIMDDPIAVQVKQADILDNLDVTRLSDFTDEDAARVRKYKRALERLGR